MSVNVHVCTLVLLLLLQLLPFVLFVADALLLASTHPYYGRLFDDVAAAAAAAALCAF
jgi:hypothetical protein